jgi:hypothetical protein
VSALRVQRDRLRAVVERRDVTIEQLQNALEEREQKLRKGEQEHEALKQRVRFLQSYKVGRLVCGRKRLTPQPQVSERSTLLPSAGGGGSGKDIESLGRGVGHQFRGLWEREAEASPGGGGGGGGTLVDRLALRVSGNLLARSRGRRCFVAYAALVHGLLLGVWLAFVNSVWACSSGGQP